ncbi:MAG TPA: sugar ABC transporter substrate-binding protein [Gemmatimonadaceae bacterium]|nr:sugar ABC transporter substrate-binding protein [Gemmatimonadaceae bacterium]
MSARARGETVGRRRWARAAGRSARWFLPLSLPLLLAGCPAATATARVELRVWAFGREGEVVQALMPEFERQNPGVRVRVQQIPWTAAHEKLLTAYVGDAVPDVAQLGNTWIPEFHALGALEPLDARIAASAAVPPDAYFPGIWATNQLHAVTYGVPWYVDTRVLFYRSDLLAAVGYAEPPRSWGQWRESMERLRARMTPRQYPILLPTNEWPQPVILGLQTGAELLRDDGRYGNFSSPRFHQAFSFYVGLFRDSLAPSVSSNEIANRYQEFARGNIAMMITGPWELGEFRRRLPAELQDDWMTAPLPGPDGPGVSMAGGASLVLFRASPHKAEGWRLIEYLSRPEQQVRFYALTGNLPARREAWRDTLLAGDVHARAFREQLERVRPLPQVPEWEQIATAVYEYGERAVRGGTSVDQALAALDQDVNAILEKRRWMLARAATP